MARLKAVFCLTFSILIAVSLPIVDGQDATRPNIVFIMADDLGYNDVSFRGGTEIPTPNMDSLAYSGIILNNYYVQPLCTPSRSALMTGRYAMHMGMHVYVIIHGEPWGLSLDETLMPQYLNELGYTSHIVGKWHLGSYCEDLTPTRRGFASHFGYLGSHEHYWGHYQPDYQGAPLNETTGERVIGYEFVRGLTDVSSEYQNQYSTDLFSDEVTRIIQEHDAESSPLFLYMAHQANHAGPVEDPIQAPDEVVERFAYIKDEKRRKYAGVLTMLDQSVGKLVSSLREKGILENTIIVLSTDNGATRSTYEGNFGSNYPLRGEKGTVNEGGTRATGIVWSPLLEARNRVSTQLMHMSDWLPTLYKAAGGDSSRLPPDLDGIDLWDALSKNQGTPARDRLVYDIVKAEELEQGPYWAVRIGDFKLVQGDVNFTEPLSLWFGDQNVANLETPEEQQLYDETVAWLRENDLVGPIMADLGMLPDPEAQEELKSAATVDCGGERPPQTPCDPMFETCIYHVGNDPCELTNLYDETKVAAARKAREQGQTGKEELAGGLTLDIVDELLAMVEQYKQTSVFTRRKPYDPASSPSLHGGLWVPWKECDGS